MASFLIKSLAGSLICFSAAALAENTSTETYLTCKEHQRVSIRHIEAGGIGYSQGYTTLEVFWAPDPGLWSLMPFLDTRVHVFNHGKWAANAGLGLRTILGSRVYGINAYYDYRNTKKLHYNQVGVGLETLGERVDLRVNGYFPVGNKITAPYGPEFEAFSDHYMILSRRFQYALKGADAEIGFHFGKTQNVDFYAAAGPYYYVGQIGHAFWGGKGRLAGTFKDYITLEISDSYDNSFHNRFQGQLTFTLPLGPKSHLRKKGSVCSCQMAEILTSRILQPVGRQEIIPVDSARKNTVATDPLTGAPLFFVFVDNTSSSLGTYESPYPTLAEAQTNSSPNDILYVFPGDGTTTGMDSGIALQASQKFWGSGISHSIQTSQGIISIPAQSSFSPIITNTNIDTEGNAITLATHNAISGFTITSALNDAIYGTDPQSLDVSSCTIKNTSTFAIEASFPENASISLTNNQFVDNVNGIFLTLNGTSSLVCSDNTFNGQTSVSSVPLEIAATSNVCAIQIKNNLFNDNTTGSIRFSLTNVVDADIDVLNNTMTHNGTGSQSSLGSNFVIISTGTNDHCSIALTDNTFSENTSNSLYLHTSGTFTNLDITASTNTMSDNGGSGLVLATPTNALTLQATDNTITRCNDNGIAVIGSGTTSTGQIAINNNTITDIGNNSNGIAISQDFSILNLTLLNNEINRCEGSGILSYSLVGIDSLTLNISDNTISNCQNLASNAASGLDIEQYTNLAASVTHNTLSGNTGLAVVIGSTLTNPTACLTLSGNSSSTDYLLSNPGINPFNLAPCNVDSVNIGVIGTSGTITPVQSCPGAAPCPP